MYFSINSYLFAMRMPKNLTMLDSNLQLSDVKAKHLTKCTNKIPNLKQVGSKSQKPKLYRETFENFLCFNVEPNRCRWVQKTFTYYCFSPSRKSLVFHSVVSSLARTCFFRLLFFWSLEKLNLAVSFWWSTENFWNAPRISQEFYFKTKEKILIQNTTSEIHRESLKYSENSWNTRRIFEMRREFPNDTDNIWNDCHPKITPLGQPACV